MNHPGTKVPIAVHLASCQTQQGRVWCGCTKSPVPAGLLNEHSASAPKYQTFPYCHEQGNVNGFSDCLNMEMGTLKIKGKCCSEHKHKNRDTATSKY